MIDNGASINLCKQSTFTISNKPHKFYVVSDEFSIDDDMILGRLILQSESAIISYYTNAIVMAGDVMNPISFLTAEERAFHLNRRADLNEQYIHEY